MARSLRSRNALALVAGTLAAALAACSLLTGLDADYMLQSAPPTGGDGADGTDADFDGPADGPGAEDGKGDGQDAGPFCASLGGTDIQFCSDFENDDGGSWSVNNNVDASIKVLPGAGNAGSRGLDVILVQAGGGSRYAWLAKAIPSAGGPNAYAHYEVQFDFRVASGASTLTYVALGTLTFNLAAIQDHGIRASDGTVFLAIGGSGGSVSDPNGLWHTARIKLDRADGSTSYARSITIGSTSVDNSTTPDPGNLGGTEIRLGAFFTPTSGVGNIHVQVDNVFVRRW